MRTPPVVRVVAGVALAGAVATSATACSGRLADNIRRREVVVHFASGATPAEHVAARAACTGLRHASPEPMPTSKLLSEQLSDVRFRVDDASDRELLNLYNCLSKQRGVVGVDIPSMG